MEGLLQERRLGQLTPMFVTQMVENTFNLRIPYSQSLQRFVEIEISTERKFQMTTMSD